MQRLHLVYSLSCSPRVALSEKYCLINVLRALWSYQQIQLSFISPGSFLMTVCAIISSLIPFPHIWLVNGNIRTAVYLNLTWCWTGWAGKVCGWQPLCRYVWRVLEYEIDWWRSKSEGTSCESVTGTKKQALCKHAQGCKIKTDIYSQSLNSDGSPQNTGSQFDGKSTSPRLSKKDILMREFNAE